MGTSTTTAACARCGLSFKATPRQRVRADEGARVYCSRDCQRGDGLVTIQCTACGKDLTRRKADVASSGRAFCDGECRNKASKPRVGTNVKCAVCPTEFWVIPSTTDLRVTCSPACSVAWQRRHRTTRACNYCGTEFVVRRSETKQSCSRACHAASKRAVIGDRYVNAKTGYAWVYVDDGTGQAKRVQEHRWVMEQHLGRELYP